MDANENMRFGRMYDPLFTTPEASEVLSDLAFIRAMLAVELAVSQALEDFGEVPKGVSAALARIDAASLDLSRITIEAADAGNLCIPFVKAVTEAVRKIDASAAGYVHWGTTSQDVIDTALLLQLRAAWQLVQRDLQTACGTLATRIPELRNLVLSGRTWLQQGPPVTMGLKMATWLDALQRQRERFHGAFQRIFVVQFGGAVGTLAAFGTRGSSIAEQVAKRLGLEVPSVPWHAQRDRIIELAMLFSMLTAILGKIGRDVSLLMQSEVAEFREGGDENKGGSSTMPHKQNPVGCAVMLSAAMRTPGLMATILSAAVQEHERGLGGWHAEWETIIEIARLTAGSLSHALEVFSSGAAYSAAMLRNMELLRGVTMAESASLSLARKLGKARAHSILEHVSRRALIGGSSLKEELAKDPTASIHFTSEELDRILDPSNYLGSAQSFIDAVLKREAAWSDNADR